MDNRYVAYVGSYTHEKSIGIHLYDMDVDKGRIAERKEIKINNPSFLALSHSQNFLYAVSDDGLTSYRILEDGDLEFVNAEPINGMRGCHICISKHDDYAAVSGYHDGKITIMRINPDGSVGKITEEIFHKGIGSIADRNFRPHISWSAFTPNEELLCVCDLGIDKIKLYEFNHSSGKLKLYDIIRTQLESAPRQMVFSEDGRFAYVLCELKNYINVYAFHEEAGKDYFEFVQNIFTLRRDHRSNSAAANFQLTSDGKHLICSNAGDNTATMYRVDQENGTLATISSLPVSGDYPKYIHLFPDEKHIMSMNHDGNTITIFAIHLDKGLIVMNGPELRISKPNNMVIKKLD